MNVRDLSLLVVDDTKFGRAVFHAALNHAGYLDIRVAASAPQALEMLDERRADVVVADWLMPEMDGLELTRRIREQDEGRHTYTAVILATAQEGTGPLATAFKRGVDDFIRKPFDNEELVARVFAAGRTANLQNALLETAERLSHSNRQLSEESMTDHLTKLGNRNYLSRQLTAQLREIASRGGSVCLAAIAIDHFDELLAVRGMPVCDELLLGVARRVSRAVRPLDTVCHLERDLFALLFYYARESGFRPYIFERLQNELGERPYATEAGDIQIGLRIGAVQVEEPEGDPRGQPESAEAVLQLALEHLAAARSDPDAKVICGPFVA